MRELNELINQLEANIDFENQLNLKVSKASAGWHIDHSLRVVIGVINVLKNSNPEEYKKTFSFKKIIVYTLGFIPRGKGKAPKAVRTFEPIAKNDLVTLLLSTRKSVEEIPNLNSDSFFKHPYFGDLKCKEAMYFTKLHTKHHIKIIEDIVNK